MWSDDESTANVRPDTTLIDYGSGIWGLSSPTHPQDSNSPDSPDELFSSGIRSRHNGIRNPRAEVCLTLKALRRLMS